MEQLEFPFVLQERPWMKLDKPSMDDIFNAFNKLQEKKSSLDEKFLPLPEDLLPPGPLPTFSKNTYGIILAITSADMQCIDKPVEEIIVDYLEDTVSSDFMDQLFHEIYPDPYTDRYFIKVRSTIPHEKLFAIANGLQYPIKTITYLMEH